MQLDVGGGVLTERDQAGQGSTGGGGADHDDDFPSLAARVSMCAEQQGLARLVFYFQLISMKAVDVPKLLPFVGWRIDVVMAKVEFLRSIGVRYFVLCKCQRTQIADGSSSYRGC